MTGSLTSHDAESPVEHWLDDGALRSIYSSQYWNDLAAERAKEWWIADGSETAYARLRAHLEESGLMEDYRVGEAYVSGMSFFRALRRRSRVRHRLDVEPAVEAPQRGQSSRRGDQPAPAGAVVSAGSENVRR